MNPDEFANVVGQFLFNNAGILIASGGLVFAGLSFFSTHRQNQVKLLEGVYRDTRDIEKQMAEIGKNSGALGINYDTTMKNWASQLFNALEWLAFLINTREITKKELVRYFEDAVVKTYDELFLMWATADQKTNEKQFPELKKLVRRFKKV